MPQSVAMSWFILWILLVGGAQAAPNRAAFEVQHAMRAARSEGLMPDPSPEGKTIAFVRIVRFEVFVESEPFFTFPNAIHALTKEDVIRRELLLKPGDKFAMDRLVESARNLRALPIFALATIVPVMAERPDQVGLLVVTRDLWSLRLENAFQFTGAQLDSLLLQLTERNLFGRNARASLRFHLLPLNLSLGDVYVNRRLFGKPLSLQQTFNVHFARGDFAYDGVSGSLNFGRPFYNLQQIWGFTGVIKMSSTTARQARGVRLSTVELESGREAPRIWQQRSFSAAAYVRKQVPGTYIQRISAGFGITAYAAKRDALNRGLSDEEYAEFEDAVLPNDRTQVFPVISYSFFRNRFRTYSELSSYGNSEDQQLGLSGGLTFRTPMGLGSTPSAVDLGAFLGWADDYLGDGLYTLGVGLETRREDRKHIDSRLLLQGRMATPRVAWGRAVLRVEWLGRFEDTGNPQVSLGGNNGLRGYPSQAFTRVGANRLRGNVEWRTPPFVWASFHTGLVAFYDAGAVYGGAELSPDFGTPKAFTLKQSVGLGLRLLVPQFNRTVTRLDLGIPVDGSGFMLTISGGSSQAVPIADWEDALLDHNIGGLAYQ